jgi:hypothetical protein
VKEAAENGLVLNFEASFVIFLKEIFLEKSRWMGTGER